MFPVTLTVSTLTLFRALRPKFIAVVNEDLLVSLDILCKLDEEFALFTSPCSKQELCVEAAAGVIHQRSRATHIAPLNPLPMLKLHQGSLTDSVESQRCFVCHAMQLSKQER